MQVWDYTNFNQLKRVYNVNYTSYVRQDTCKFKSTRKPWIMSHYQFRFNSLFVIKLLLSHVEKSFITFLFWCSFALWYGGIFRTYIVLSIISCAWHLFRRSFFHFFYLVRTTFFYFVDGFFFSIISCARFFLFRRSFFFFIISCARLFYFVCRFSFLLSRAHDFFFRMSFFLFYYLMRTTL